MADKIVIALGGNALQESGKPATAEAQLDVVKNTVEYIADISERGYEVAVVHGNGPQVGRILLASETAADVTPPMPFDVCGAMSQGYIGYHIQQSLRDTFIKRNKDIPVVTLVTQVKVNENDPAFQNPTKPIGPFYSAEEAEVLEKEKGYTMKEDAGRGFRRVVASPIPEEIVELDSLKRLFDSTVVITAGGGGIPVIEKGKGNLEGVAAVIDKDYAAEKVAEDIDADVLMVLTEVECACTAFGTPEQTDLRDITVAEAEKYVAEGHFAAGSMLPKMNAAIKFAKSKPGRRAIITSLYKATEALDGNTGTIITQ